MGYTHLYFSNFEETPLKKWPKAWKRLVADTWSIIDAPEIEIGGPNSDEDPDEPIIVDEEQGIKINGIDGEGNEPFLFGPTNCGCTCKTDRKPYDLVVACILLRAHALGLLCFSSDGGWDEYEWLDARRLYSKLWPREGKRLRCPWRVEEEEEEEEDVQGNEDQEEQATAKHSRMLKQGEHSRCRCM